MESNRSHMDAPIGLIHELKENGRSTFSLKYDDLNSAFSTSNLSYHILAIVGAQNSGKSTLYNKVFNLSLRTMNQKNFSRTTNGMDMVISSQYPYILLDMEGINSVERYREDASYIERMIPPFALQVSSLLIYNININDICQRSYVESIAKMIANYLIICREHRKILFCVRDVSSSNDKENIVLRIRESFHDAITVAKTLYEQAESEKTKSPISIEQIARLFQIGFAFMSPYNRINKKFYDEKTERNDIKAFRNEIERLLRGTKAFSVNKLPLQWSEIWRCIHEREMINSVEMSKYVVELTNLKERLSSECFNLGPDYENQLNKLEEEFKKEIEGIKDRHVKERFKSELKEMIIHQRASAEVRNFRKSVLNYIQVKTQSGKNLYADLISMYREMEVYQTNMSRNEYANKLFEESIKGNKYMNLIEKAINEIYTKAYEKINKIRARSKKEFPKIEFEIAKLNQAAEKTVSMFWKVLAALGLAAIGVGIGAAVGIGIGSAIGGTVLRVPSTTIGGVVGGVGGGVGGFSLFSRLFSKKSLREENVWRNLADHIVDQINSDKFTSWRNNLENMITS